MRATVALLLLISFLVTAPPRPARACSCAGPIDLKTSIDGAEAAFVGTLIEKRDAGMGDFGGESVYVFEVEEWVKGDLGEVIEVRSASDGAGCGFEFFGEERIGAFLRLEGGDLESGLCEQVDPDALLVAAKGPVMSTTGIGHLLVANGWSSPRLTVIDRDGATVVDLSPGGDVEPFTGTTQLALCPDGRYVVQLTSRALEVWDLSTLTNSATYPATSPDGQVWLRTISCRSNDASSILGVGQSETGATLYEIVPEWTPVFELPGDTWHFGTSFVIAQVSPEADPVLVDIANGNEIVLHETPAGALQAINVAPHPSRDEVGMLETRFPNGEGRVESTLLLLDSNGETLRTFEIPWEAYSPVWLDEERLMVQAYDFNDWERSLAYLFDVVSGDTTIIEGWRGAYPIADGTTIYGIDGARVMTADTTSGQIETLATLPAEFAGPIIKLRGQAPIEVTTTTTTKEPDAGTTPPLVAPEGDVAEEPSPGLQLLAATALAAFVIGLFWLARRSP